ncbi:alpha/beta fold hydrolase [Spiractinospora alimapuensis]|uniref:alpha/beta fold hydrolase n=1 Tax=Spiractinospora alimapuensis TaxID=2820884 RepID=UPI001F3C76F1|nr:alpha/beta fold hydrolase [Spiractinospora alimapuensis]QVQ51895.1 alpha/beta fold hydrolase [Spiractinospora alimapuensis]
MRSLARVVLVHSPLVGPSSWRRVAALLRARGWGGVVPTLSHVFDDAPPFGSRLAAAVAAAGHGEEPVVLVAHSGAGPILPQAAALVTAPVRGAIYVDAQLPRPGLSWLDTAPAELVDHLRELATGDRLPPWNEWFPPHAIRELLPDPRTRTEFCAELPAVPFSYFEEPASPRHVAVPGRAYYLRLSDAYAAEADAATDAGWPVVREAAHHLAILTDPELIAATLDPMIRELVT